MQASSNTKIRSRCVQLPIHRPEQDGPRTLACPYRSATQPLSTSFYDHVQNAIAWVKNPSLQPPLLMPGLLTKIPNEPIKLPTFEPLNIEEHDMLLHPVHELFQTIVATMIPPQPRGRAKKQELQGEPRMIEILSPEQYYDKDYLIGSAQTRPLPCIQLARRKYLHLGPPTYLNALKTYGIVTIPFFILPRPRGIDPANNFEETVALSARRAFDGLKEEPLYLRPDVRERVYIALGQLELDSYFLGSSPDQHIQRHHLQLACSTVRRKRQQASSRRPFPGSPR